MRISRWIPTASMLLVSLISYIDRNTLALLAPTILKETRLSGAEYGVIVSAFSLAYTIGNPLWGRALDRMGLRLGMLAAVALWTAASASHALAAGFLSFALARAALGFGEGATFPGGLRTVMQTLEPPQYSRGLAVAYSGGSLGAIITPVLVGPIEARWGWRAAFIFTGIVGAAWLALWLVVSRRKDVGAVRAVHAAGARPDWRDRRLWSFMLAYALGALPLAYVIYYGAIFLAQSLGKTQAQISGVLWIPPLGWEVGYFFWGALSDRLMRGAADPIAALRRLMGAAMLLSLPLAATPHLAGFAPVMAELFFSMFVAAGFIILTMAYATRVYSSSHAGLIAGLGAGAWSGAVMLAMPVFGKLVDWRRWDVGFGLAAVMPVAGYAVWRALNRAADERE